MKIDLNVPYGLRFNDLALRRSADGAVVFDMAAVREICKASGLPPDTLEEPRFVVVLPLVLHGWLEITKIHDEGVDDAGRCAELVDELVAKAMQATPDPEPFALQLRPLPRSSVSLH